MDTTLNWYGVKLLYRCTVTGKPDPSLIDGNYIDGYVAYEESVILVQASDFDGAFDKAETFAKEEESQNTNYYGQLVSKLFYDFIDCYWIPSDGSPQLTEGVEVYSNVINSHISIDPEDFIEHHFKISDGIKYMLLDRDLPPYGKEVS